MSLIDVLRRTFYVLLGFAYLILLLHWQPLCAQPHLPSFWPGVRINLIATTDCSLLDSFRRKTWATHSYTVTTYRLEYRQKMTDSMTIPRLHATALYQEHLDNI